MGTKPDAAGIRPNRDRIEVRFMWEGKQIAPTLNMKPTASNLKHAARIRDKVLQEIQRGTFKFKDYFPDYRNADIRRQWGEVFHDYFEFSIFAGLRSSEQIALLWEDVEFRTGRILVRRSRVMGQDKERTKTHVEREVELNGRALAALQRQRARTQAIGKQVFYNPATERAYMDEQKQLQVWTRSLRTCQVRYRPPKECRDTSVTMALMAGANPVWVANQHGHSVQVMMRDYAKWIPNADKGSNLAAVNAALGMKPEQAKKAI